MADQTDPLLELQDLRGSIDNIDAAMIHMLAERFRCTQRVGALKARHALPPADPARSPRWNGCARWPRPRGSTRNLPRNTSPSSSAR